MDEKSEKRLNKLCKATGWDREKAIAELKKAEAEGISNYQYLKKSCYTLPDMREMGRVLAELKKQRDINYEFYIDTAVRKMKEQKYPNVTRGNTIVKMDEAKEKGISYLKYVQYEVWNKNPEEVEFLINFLKEDKKRLNRNKKMYLNTVCEKTGWSKGKAELEIAKAKLLCACSYEDYCVFRFWKLTDDEKKKYVTLGDFIKMRLTYNARIIARKYFDDKIIFNETFADGVTRVFFGNQNLSYEDFVNYVKNIDAIIVKPLHATQGKGIQKFICNESEERNKEIYNELVNMEPAIAEEYIVQHPELMAFCPNSVNTIRIMTLNFNGECKFLHSVLRMGRGAVVDNFHSGGIAASVDVETGIVYTNAADLDGNVFETNPATGKKIKGFQVPNWDKLLEVCKKINGRVEGVNLVGWDFAITPDGVELIEGNSGASYVVAQIPNIEDGIGLRDQMVTPYLDNQLNYKKAVECSE